MGDFKHAEIIGPFVEPEYHYAVVNGCTVPHIKIVKKEGKEDGKVEIHLDGRFIYIIDDTALDLVLNLLANAMAVSAGYSSHGPESKPINKFAIRMIGIGGMT